jgi:lipopolysaccharide transport system ATP-binding protein
MSDIAIHAEGLSKQFRIGQKRGVFGSRQTLTDKFSDGLKSLRTKGRPADPGMFWALQDVSFQVHHGDVVGIIGRNGAGKSTLLKILSRITEPTLGFADIYGRVGSLLEVGVGFHPELTGRENIFLSGAIQGMKKAEIQRKFDEIVAFAETEKFVDMPVKRYSSGMYLRLAFAVAAHLEQEILLVDEVLAVGDAQFQKKCIGKMQDVAERGRTVLFVSHNMAAVANLCQRTILLNAGHVDLYGPTHEVIERYVTQGADRSTVDLLDREDREGNGRLRFSGIELQTPAGRKVPQVPTGQDIRLVVRYQAKGTEPLANVDVACHVRGSLGELYMVCQASISGGVFPAIAPRGSMVCTIPRIPLPPGIYSLSLWCQVGSGGREDLADRIENVMQLEVIDGDFYGTGKLPAHKNRSVLVPYVWDLDPEQVNR